MEEMQAELIEDLTAELSISDDNFNSVLLIQKVKQALREVKDARSYPSSYTDEKIDGDIQKFYSQARNIALYDYNKIGMDFEASHSEDGITFHHEDRDKLFSGIIPLAKC